MELKMIEYKVCTQCKKNLPSTEYRGRGNGKLRSECKKCGSKYDKKTVWKRDLFYSVYFLPNENYVGYTNNLKSRMNDHKKNGKDITDFKIIGKYDTAVKAHLVETLFHFIGLEGFHQGNTKENTIIDSQLDIFTTLKEIL
jgi:hypothetical protein